ncbi:MAG: VOC family protein [Microthrixaceae bacterium]
MSEPVVNVSTVVINVNDMAREKAFWGELLGVGVQHDVGDFFVWFEPQTPGGVAVALQLVEDAKVGPNRLHLDTAVADATAARERIEELGGSHVEDHEMAGFRWTIMADPEGNEFCITSSH